MLSRRQKTVLMRCVRTAGLRPRRSVRNSKNVLQLLPRFSLEISLKKNYSLGGRPTQVPYLGKSGQGFVHSKVGGGEYTAATVEPASSTCIMEKDYDENTQDNSNFFFIS